TRGLLLPRLGRRKAPVPGDEVREAGDEEHPGGPAHHLRVQADGQGGRPPRARPQQPPHHPPQGARVRLLRGPSSARPLRL
ncbi:uncharacterized protein ACA1_027390, partial [Acanthamoeba castellanii str. Neff]